VIDSCVGELRATLDRAKAPRLPLRHETGIGSTSCNADPMALDTGPSPLLHDPRVMNSWQSKQAGISALEHRSG